MKNPAGEREIDPIMEEMREFRESQSIDRQVDSRSNSGLIGDQIRV